VSLIHMGNDPSGEFNLGGLGGLAEHGGRDWVIAPFGPSVLGQSYHDFVRAEDLEFFSPERSRGDCDQGSMTTLLAAAMRAAAILDAAAAPFGDRGGYAPCGG
jgi:hypothetical protein